jgi:type IX secretion system PorP/SprF family membrane protein
LLVFSLGEVNLSAQEYPISNQYHFNYYLANPAVAGSTDCSYFMLTHHQQWVGVSDAPMTDVFAFQTRLKNNVGLGAYLFTDKNGYSLQQGAQLTFAYHLLLDQRNRYSRQIYKDRQLSFAVSAKFFNFDFDPQLYLLAGGSTTDPAYQNLASAMAFNANVGAYFVSYGFFAGLSFTNLAPMKMPAYDVNLEPIIPLTGLFFIGNEFQTNSTERLEPSLMIKANALGEWQGDANIKYSSSFPKDNFAYWLQLTYRHGFDANNNQSLNLMPMVGFQFDKFHIGYTYTVDLNRLVRHSYGTHQIMLGYTLCSAPERFCR